MVTANLLTGLNIDEYFTRTAPGITSTLLADALGSTVGLVGSSGSIATSYTYQPFGATTTAGTSNSNPYQFTGRENDGTGFYFYRARYYNPTFQRFIAQDPIGFAGGGPNLYGYVAESPAGYVDPLGLWRMPDYVSVNLNVAIPNPWTGTLVGWSGTASLDRYGDWFWSPLGGEIGKSATFVSGSLTGNWLDQSCTPARTQLSNFLSSNGGNVAGGYWGGISRSYTPGSGFATGFGLVTPQIGLSYNYSFYGGNVGFGW